MEVSCGWFGFMALVIGSLSLKGGCSKGGRVQWILREPQGNLREHWRELEISRLSTPLGGPSHKDTIILG